MGWVGWGGLGGGTRSGFKPLLLPSSPTLESFPLAWRSCWCWIHPQELGRNFYFLPAERNASRNGREKKGRNSKKTHPPASPTGEPMGAGSGAAANLSRLLRGSGSRRRASEATASSRVAASLARKCRGSDWEIRAGGWRRAGKCRAGGRREGEAPASCSPPASPQGFGFAVERTG